MDTTVTRYRRSEAISFTELDGELVCLNLESGQYTGLKDVGQAIWEQLDRPLAFTELVDYVTAEYDVEPGQASDDVRAFLSQLQEAGLVETD